MHANFVLNVRRNSAINMQVPINNRETELLQRSRRAFSLYKSVVRYFSFFRVPLTILASPAAIIHLKMEEIRSYSFMKSLAFHESTFL